VPREPVDQWFPRLGQCGICGAPGMDQRHRIIEAIADAMDASNGDAEDELAADYGVPVEAVQACAEWMRAHPDGREDSGDA
jgi:uncharacterized protein (DUF433 family)